MFAYTAAIEASIKLANDLEFPGRIASNVVNYRSMESFEPSIFTTMSYRVPGHACAAPPVRDGGDDRPAVVGGLRRAVPAAAAGAGGSADRPAVHGASTRSATWTQTSSLRLGNTVDGRWTSTTVRASGSWLVERWYDSEDYGLDLQSLELHYTNWEMQPETAWLIPHDDGDYSFRIVSPEKTATFNLATCHEDHTCWTTNAIHYLNPDGNPLTAFLEPYQPPTGAPTASALAPLLGHAVTFNAGNFAPGDPRGMMTYRWRFQKEGCWPPARSSREIGRSLTTPLRSPDPWSPTLGRHPAATRSS